MTRPIPADQESITVLERTPREDRTEVTFVLPADTWPRRAAWSAT
ncbi:hypothetical protein ACIRO3_29875 [Streptomyces sp. NPDC102278]